ncbi:uncharacterized protein LOC117675611 [Pantherophis guttatus]|uniref:Uncharacterized protein LOC117675611 n=1 Tax=Pantherophis guttatus TaxID=94885 RepID=A0A6P9DGD1_PANGU|nr:uncharacterized protein LOC117675611 [Pantherophis guttatus]
MERVDGTRWSWRPASVCAVFLGNICFFIASLTVLVLSLTKQQSSPHQSSTSSQVSAAHLVLNLNGSTNITRGTLDWFYSDVEGAFLGPSFEYSSQKLKIKKDGLYCIYAQINVNRRGYYSNKTMNADLYIHRKHESSPLLTLTLHLSARVKKSYTNYISQIHRLSCNDRLYGTLKGTTEADINWALENSGNFFGIFRINEK